MKFRCSRCRAEVPLPPVEMLEQENVFVTCPSCGARYRRRRPGEVRRPDAVGAPTTTSAQYPTAGMTRATVDGGGTAASPRPARTHDVPRPATAAVAQAAAVAVAPDHTMRMASQPGTGLASSLPAADSSTVHLPSANFQPEQLIAGRYRIVRFIAKGGMGEVYEAEDLELRERVALKTIRPRTAGVPIAIASFKREIQLARRVTHPNVCRMFDVGRHVPGEGQAAIIFLTMELLAGKTLAEHLREHGPMSPEVALPIVRQMAAALGAAHGAGIVHRDFKCDNVILVPTAEGLRAVVTDFGVARGTANETKVDGQVTSTGDIVGTPAYMAPEQITGGQITGAADTYALGVVLYEMMTGRVPFIADTALATAALRLTHAPPRPREIAPTVDPRWEEAILRCLDREPAQRFGGDAEEVARFLAHEDQASLAAAAAARQEAFEQEKRAAVKVERLRTLDQETRHKKTLAEHARSQKQRLALVLVLLLATGYLAYSRIRHQLEEGPGLFEPPSNIEARSSVAVLGFRNVSGKPEAAWLSTALAEMLRTELARSGQLRMIPGENVARMKVELALADVDSLASDTLLKVRDNLGTDFVLLGSYVVLAEGNLRLDLRLQNATNGETLAALSENGSEAQLFDVVSTLGTQLREVLDIRAATSPGKISPVPSNPEAARLYAEGLDRLRQFDPGGARELLTRAVEVEPDHAMVHSALASALAASGFQQESLEANHRAYDLSAQLPDEERLAVEGQYREAAEQWERAIQIYEALWSGYPDNLEYGLQLADALVAAGRGEEALTTVAALRRLPSQTAEDPRLDLAEAAAAVTLAQFRRQEAAAERAAAKATGLGAVLLVAEARVTQAEALRHLGRNEDAMQAVSEAKRLFEERENRPGRALAQAEEANILFAAGKLDEALALYESSRQDCALAGDQGCVLRAMNNLAVVLRNQGELEAAKRNYVEILELARELGSSFGEVNALNNLGAVLFTEGRLDAAKERFGESLELGRELGRKSLEALALANLGAVERGQGRLDEAQKLLAQALRIREEIGQLPGQAAALNSLGQVALDRGEPTEAKRHFTRALELSQQVASRSLEADSRHNLGLLARIDGNTAQAREHLEAARDARRDLGQMRDLGRSNLALADLAIDELVPQIAADATRRLADEFVRDGAVEEAALANAVLSRASLSLGDLGAAEAAIARASELASRTERRSVHLTVRIGRARVLQQRRHRQEAHALLTEAAQEAAELGLLELELEARLGLLELAAAAGSGQARQDLRRFEDEASQHGYRNLAQRAAELAAS